MTINKTKTDYEVTYNGKYRWIAANDERQMTEASDSVSESNRKLHLKIVCTVL